jgi:hypothetical protein
MFALPLLGGGAIMAGVLLPWMTFYAGLQRLNGLQGVHGWWLLSAGVAAVVLTALQWRAPTTYVACTAAAGAWCHGQRGLRTVARAGLTYARRAGHADAGPANGTGTLRIPLRRPRRHDRRRGAEAGTES